MTWLQEGLLEASCREAKETRQMFLSNVLVLSKSAEIVEQNESKASADKRVERLWCPLTAYLTVQLPQLLNELITGLRRCC